MFTFFQNETANPLNHLVAKLPRRCEAAWDAFHARAILHVHWPSRWKSIWTFGLCGWGKMCKHREKMCDDNGRSRGGEKRHSLHSVLGVCFSLPTNRRGRVQEAVLPDRICAVAIKSLDHLEVRRRKKVKLLKSNCLCISSLRMRLHNCLDSNVHVLTCNWEGGHAEWVRCRTWELCRPRPRWMLQHSSQISTPLFTEAQRGSVTGWKLSLDFSRTTDRG